VLINEQNSISKWLHKNITPIAIISSSITALLLCLVIIYGFKNYGIALFIFIPLLIGAMPIIIYSSKQKATKTIAFSLGLKTLIIVLLCLLVFAFEGLICIAMVTPIACLLMWIGSIIGYIIINKTPDKSTLSIILLIGSIPITSYVEKNMPPSISKVSTSIEINANIQTVWNNVIEFPELNTPTEFIFKTGISYPINAKIVGTGEGAIRYCNFTTGSFVEPITKWQEPYLLQFDVQEQPIPMKEISIWDIEAPHLHDYFVSQKGEFKLSKINENKTLLEGTTWYYHNITPEFYWRTWSNYIIHQIHKRVLYHIKTNAEKSI
jgi:hypothetical protein